MSLTKLWGTMCIQNPKARVHPSLTWHRPMFPRSFARPFALLAILVCGVGTAEHAQPKSIFGDASPTLVTGEFQLPDGAAWDGNSTLIIPDVKAKRLYSLNTNKPGASPSALVSESGSISGTCFQLGKLYLADNVRARLARKACLGTRHFANSSACSLTELHA